MKNAKRILALILTGLLAVTALVSCKDDEGKTNSEGNGAEAEAEASLEVPKGIAEGKSFDMYLALPSVKSSFVAEEETGDDINDAVFQRNALVKEHTGADLTFAVSTRTTTGGDQQAETSLIRTLIQAGDDTYDAFVHVQHSGMPTLIEEKLFLNWNDLPHVNLDNPWWYSNVKRDI